MGLYSLFKVIVLITNALAILHEKRFLPKIGLATGADVVPDQFGQVQQGGLKDKIATLLQAVRILLRSTYLQCYRTGCGCY
jgi:hypothetical protein